MQGYQSIEVLQFRSDCIVCYSYPLEKKYSLQPLEPTQGQQENIKYTGSFTPFARKNLKRCLHIINNTSAVREVYNPVIRQYHSFKLSLLTLTLSAEYDEHKNIDISRNLLSPFLKTCTNKYGLTKYVWRAEFQKNGNIHYHVVSDMFCAHDKIKYLWNRLQANNNLLTTFIKKHGHENPNSIDLRSIIPTADSFDYLAKYAIKDSNSDRLFKGRLWDASKNIKSKRYFEIDSTSEHYGSLYNYLLSGSFERVYIDRCTIFKPVHKSILSRLPEPILLLSRNHFLT